MTFQYKYKADLSVTSNRFITQAYTGEIEDSRDWSKKIEIEVKPI